MFDTTRITPVNNLKFNSVSGTICKSHPKSFFLWFELGSKDALYLMGSYPTFKGNSVVVLQAMLTGENRAIVEIVREKDFFEKDEKD